MNAEWKVAVKSVKRKPPDAPKHDADCRCKDCSFQRIATAYAKVKPSEAKERKEEK